MWAPCLARGHGIFHLVYTVIMAFYCNMYDTRSCIVTVPDISGPFSCIPLPAEGARRRLSDKVDAFFLSDEACAQGRFIGTMAGLCFQNLTFSRLPADFDDYEMRGFHEKRRNVV